MATTLLCPLVGTHFRPGGKVVLSLLPAGTSLRLAPEPENPYDPKAIKVLVDLQSIPESLRENLCSGLIGTGIDGEELLSSGEDFFLGYIGDSDGKVCKAASPPLPGNREAQAVLDTFGAACGAELRFFPDGKPALSVGFYSTEKEIDSTFGGRGE